MEKLHIVNHPLITNKISMLRDKNTGHKDFRELVEEIATFVCYEATRDVALENVTLDTPNGTFDCQMVVDQKFVIVPILRAGIGMVNGCHNLMPNAKVGHIGLYRDPETLQAVEYFCKLPVDIASDNTNVFIIDPMLATGGTAIAAITFLKNKNIKNIKLLVLISCPEGVKAVHEAHPDVHIYTAAHDEKLNSHSYIIPGLGDAGDRLFGTK